MTKTDLASIHIGDSVLGAFGLLDEHTVCSASGMERWGKRRCRYVRLTLGENLDAPARLLEDGPEVLVKVKEK